MKGCLQISGISGKNNGKLENQFEKDLLIALVVEANQVRRLLANGLYDILGAAIQFKLENIKSSSDALNDKDPAIVKLKVLLVRATEPEQESYCRNNIAILMSGLLKVVGKRAVESVVNDAVATSGYSREELDLKLDVDIKSSLPNTYQVAFRAVSHVHQALVSDMSITEMGNPFADINNPRRSARSLTDDVQEGRDSPTVVRKEDGVTAVYQGGY